MTSVEGGSLEGLARDIAGLKKRVKTLSRKPQLTHSAIDDGAVVVTSDGVTTAIVGVQFDGATEFLPVTGPVPPVPTMPTAVSVVGGIRVTVPGTFADTAGGPTITPSNFSRYDIEVSTDSAFPEFVDPRAPNSGSVISASGGQIKVGWPTAGTPLYVRTRTRTSDGQRSAPSQVFGPVASGQVGLGDLGFDLAEYVASSSIAYGPTAPADPAVGALWLKEVAALPLPQYETWRWTGAQWVKLTDQGVTDSLVAASAAQAAADAKAKVYTQASMPAHSGAAGTAVWFDSDDGHAPYRWNGSTFVPMLLGNGAIQPNSLVASSVVATGTISAALLETLLVLTTAVVAGDAVGEHSRLDSTGIRAYANDEGLPVEIGYFGRGLGVRNPTSGLVVGGIDESGVISGSSLSIEDPDPSFGGTLLSERDWEKSWGNVAYGVLPAGANLASINTEGVFMDLAFTAVRGRQYVIFIEGVQPLNSSASPGGWCLRVRQTNADAPAEPAAPTTASPLVRLWTWADSVDGAWNQMTPNFALYNGPALDASADRNVRLVFTYGVGTGSAPSAGASMGRAQGTYFWVMDVGPLIPETGNEVIGGAATGGVTTKTNYTYEATASYVRTWNQSGSIIYDDEMHQGYGDSFNGLRRANAGWGNVPSMTGATVNEVAIYMESYHWYSMSGGTLHMGMTNNGTEPAAFSVGGNYFDIGFSARAQGKWIICPSSWKTSLAANALKGIGIFAPSTASAYYGKFKGPASARPRLRIKYTK